MEFHEPTRGKNIDAIFPLSPTQQGLLFHTLYAPASGVYFEQVTCTFNKGLDVTNFRRAWQTVVERHPAMRTLFKWEKRDRPLQVVLRQVTLPWIEEDWRELGSAQQRERLERLLEAERRPGFALDRAPLMRCGLFRLAEERYQFVWSYHHLLLDGWSVPVLLKEVFSFYEAYSRGQELRLPTPRPYWEYIAWLQKQSLAEAEAYWRERLSGFTAPVPLGAEPGPDTRETHEHREFERRLPRSFTSDLRALARRLRVTPNVLLQGAWGLLLHRYSGEAEVVFGATVSGRPPQLPGVESMIGLFINALPVRMHIADELLLSDWLRELHGRQVEAERYSHTPLFRIQSWSQVPRHLPLFESLLIFENYPIDGSLEDSRQTLGITDIRIFQLTNYPLTLVVLPEDELILRIHYDTGRFEEPVIERMSRHLVQLLHEFVARPEGRLGELSLLTALERERLLAQSRAPVATGGSSHACLHEQFDQQALATPDATAVVFGTERVSYQELARRANRLAHQLIARGVGPEVRVGLCTERSVQLVVGILAILKAGGAYVPLDPHYPAERLAWILEDSGARVLLTQAALREQLPSSNVEVLDLDAPPEDLAPHLEQAPTAGARPSNLCYIIYTSGSTGRPKGVCVEHRHVVHLFDSTRHLFGVQGGDVWTLFHSYAFDFSVWELWGALLHGGTLVVVPYWVSRVPADFHALLVSEKVTVLNQTPSAFAQLSAWEQSASPTGALSLRLVIFGGEALEPTSLRAWFDRHGDEQPRLVNMYGITETTVHVTHRRMTRQDTQRGRSLIGGPIPGLELYVLDSRREPVPEGIVGELYVGGAGVSRGYLNRPELDAARFIASPLTPGGRLYRTGDLARRWGDGELEYLGRSDGQVKIRGFRIELGEIEAVLASHPSVREAMVNLFEDPEGHRRLAAYVVARAGGVEPAELRNHLKQRVPEHMIPSVFLELEALPLTPSGKRDRKALPSPVGMPIAQEAAYIAPRTPTEATLARIWAEVLGRERVSIQETFFEAGGDSITSIQVLSRARRAGLEFTLEQLFREQTIEQLARALGEGARSAAPRSGPFSLVSAEDRARLPPGVEDAYPLAALQAGMLLWGQPDGGVPRYHVVNAFSLRVPFDEEKLRQALQQLLARHPVLRSSFHLTRFQEPLQLVHEHVPTPLTVEDLRHHSTGHQQPLLDTWWEAERRNPFDGSQAPLLRVRVHRLGEDTFQLSVSEHHCILDGWSSALVVTELCQEYLALLGRLPPPPPIEVSTTFRDFIALERQAVASEECRRFWDEQCSNLGAGRLPRWPQAPHETSRSTGQYEVPLPSSLGEELRTLARDLQVPLKSVLLAAHFHVLAMASGQPRVTTGVVFNGRPEEHASERVLGLFLNTLPLTQELSNGTWRELIQQVFALERAVLPYRRFPLAEIQRRRIAAFEVAFNFTHFHVYRGLLQVPGLELLGTRSSARTGLPLIAEFSVDAQTSQLGLRLDHAPEEFPPEQLASLARLYVAALSAMAHSPGARHEQAVPGEERERWRLAAPPAPASRAVPLPARAAPLAPLTRTEQVLARLWSELLGVEDIGLHDDFFDRGGDSLLMLRLSWSTARELGRGLSIDELLRFTTLEAQARRLDAAVADTGDSALVEFLPGSAKRRLFFIPGAGGEIFYLRDLSRALHGQLSVCGVRVRGPREHTSPDTYVEAVAAQVLPALLRLQPEGPYLLGGHSFGGWVAFELARRLRADGHEVELLAIVDSRAPVPEHLSVSAGWDDARWTRELRQLMERFFAIPLQPHAAESGAPEPREALAHLQRQLVTARVLPPELEPEQLLGWLEAFKSHHQARYAPQGLYPGTLMLLRAQQVHTDEAEHAGLLVDPSLGWGRLCSRPVLAHSVPGDHISMMRAPHVEALAARLRHSLESPRSDAGR